MDNYIRFFNVNHIKTEEVSYSKACNEIRKINDGNETFKLFHNNVRSINKDFDEISVILFQQKKCFDCIVLIETHQIDNIDKYNLPGYTLLYNYGKVNQFDGTVVYRKDKIFYNTNLIKIHDISVIQLEITFNNKSILILALYRSPSLPQTELVGDLQDLTKMNKRNDYQIIVGDLNIQCHR